MGIKDKSRTAAAGASVALAAAGLSSCKDYSHGDPVPPPLQCNTVDEGQTLSATATVTGRELRVTIRVNGPGDWTAVEITSVVGGSARPVTLTHPLVVVIDLTDETVTSGSFTLRGALQSGPSPCAVSRTFTFAIGPNGVVVASADELPLPARQQARIALVARNGHDVELEATTPFRGARTIAWNVSGGEILSREGARLRWRLPAEAGLYQAELVIDYGLSGLSFDTLALEVG
jgi:hypothetical protein